MVEDFNEHQIIDAYLNAHRAANRSEEPPHLAYRKGWFTMRYNFAAFGTKHRRSEIERMIARLNERAASHRDTQEVGR